MEEFKIKCPACRSGYYHYCSTTPPIYTCSNYGAGCNKAISKEEYEEIVNQIMPKMSLYQIKQVIYDTMREKQSNINRYRKESDKKEIDIAGAIGWMMDLTRTIVDRIE